MHLWSIKVETGGLIYTYEIGGSTLNTPQFIINSTIFAGDDIGDFATLENMLSFFIKLLVSWTYQELCFDAVRGDLLRDLS